MAVDLPTELIVWRRSHENDVAATTLVERDDAAGFELRFRNYFTPRTNDEHNDLITAGNAPYHIAPSEFIKPPDLVGSDNNQMYLFPPPTNWDIPNVIQYTTAVTPNFPRVFPRPCLTFTYFMATHRNVEAFPEYFDQIHLRFPDSILDRSLLPSAPFRAGDESKKEHWNQAHDICTYSGDSLDATLRFWHYHPLISRLEYHAKWNVSVVLTLHKPMILADANVLIATFQTLLSASNHGHIPISTIRLRSSHPEAYYVSYVSSHFRTTTSSRTSYLQPGSLEQTLKAMPRAQEVPYLWDKVLYQIHQSLATARSPAPTFQGILGPLVTGLEYYASQEAQSNKVDVNLARTARNIGDLLGVNPTSNGDLSSRLAEWRHNYYAHQKDNRRDELKVVSGHLYDYAYLLLCGKALIDAGFDEPDKVLSWSHPVISELLRNE